LINVVSAGLIIKTRVFVIYVYFDTYDLLDPALNI